VPTAPPLLEEVPPVPCCVLPPEADVPPLPSACPDEPEEQPAAKAASVLKAAIATFAASLRPGTSRRANKVGPPWERRE
jgi:hypothetical protein